MPRSEALKAAQDEHDKARAARRVVLRLTEAEAKKVARAKRREETPAAFFRRLLAER